MSIKTIIEEENYPTICPNCRHELIFLDGTTIKWLKCTNCKFKKLAPQREKIIKVTAIEEDKPRVREPQKIRFVVEE